MSKHAPAPSHCENCGTALRGGHCHACGQPAANPIRHAAHAIEDVFESFWHLDGRVFRTLRDLLFPGRVARNYLAGQRVRYIAPLRLLVILSLLTFFVGKLVVHADGPVIQVDGADAAISRAQTVAEVEQARDHALAALAPREREANKTPGASPALVMARTRIEGQAADRIKALRQAQDAPSADGKPAAAATPRGNVDGAGDGSHVFDRNWDPKRDPIAISWLPDVANRWLTPRVAKARDNLLRTEGDSGELFLRAFMGAVPTALFVLVPVFALLLKLCYLGSGRLYLEHLVVALYSHAYMLLALLASFLLVALGGALARAGWTVPLPTLAVVLLWCWVPVYLWRMQHRVYAQGWFVTTLRYLVVGSIYLVLVTLATMYAMVAGLLGM